MRKYTKSDTLADRGVRQEEGSDYMHFLCPCGARIINITQSTWGASFNANDELSSGGSVGYREYTDFGRANNWCHFQVTDGVPTMYGDAQCPGSKININE